MAWAVDVGAGERGNAEHDLDPAREHVIRKPVPQMQHRRATPMVAMHAGPAQLHEPAPSTAQGFQVIFGIAVKAALAPRARVAGQQPVNPDHVFVLSRVAAAVDEQKMVEVRIKRRRAPAGCRDRPDRRPRPIPRRKTRIAQSLRTEDVILAVRPGAHRTRAVCAQAGAGSLRRSSGLSRSNFVT
jgi:hypothetical protein